MKQSTFTPEEFAECAREALENWTWDPEILELESEFVADMKEALNFDAEYARETFADDDGLIKIDRAFNDVWDQLDEFARSTAYGARANRQYWGGR